ncbi:hypothetical protein BDP27DRAFT_1325404 [Rhodocollybia butyracea]|uniref:Uncharacterized protein n=1 Tax=Rhodocollybia butyracea TaxID=206335 RepID=A0A9P5U846_9AGAR|nr:hypothetical protein BDP27DRAFT_1325404 [Rhodocollybia butyracea]
MRDPYPSLKEAHSKGLKRIKSLGMLKRNRRKSISAANTSQEPAPRSPRAHSRSKSALISTPSKKSAHPPLPPTLASELLLRQFTDGGSLETHAKRIMEEQARDAAPAGSHKRAPLPVGTVYRDENGTLWRDEDEKLEREALLPPGTPESPVREWITFTPPGSSSPALPGMGLGVGAATEERRGSLASITSSLSQNNLVTPADVFAYGGMHTFSGPPSPLSWSGSTRVPVSPTGTMSTTTGMAAASGTAAQNKRTRRRPAPLTLRDPATPDVFDDSFIPSPRAVALASIVHGMTSHRRSSTGGLSAPPAFTEFGTVSVDGHESVPMKDNVKADELDSASSTTMDSRKGLGMRKISKLNLKSMKALFGGHAQ